MNSPTASAEGLRLLAKNYHRAWRHLCPDLSKQQAYGPSRDLRTCKVHGLDAVSMNPQGVRLQILRNRLSKAYRGQPIVSNEDDHYDFDRPDNNFVAAIGEGVSWGYFDYRMNREGYSEGFQSLPVDWSLSTHRKKGFFNLLKQVTGV